MNFTIERTQYPQVRNAIKPLFELVNQRAVPTEQFDWKYEQCPLGMMTVWVAKEQQTGKIIGSYGAYPRHFLSGGKTILAYQRADSIVHPDYQGQGIFRELVGTMTKDLRAEGAHFHFGYSNDLSSRVHRKFPESRELFESLAYTLPNGSRSLRERSASLRWPRLSAIAFPLLGMMFKSANHLIKAFSLSQYKLEDADNFGDLPGKWSVNSASEYSYFPLRDQDFLNWKIFNAPTELRKNLTTHWLVDQGERVGYVILYKIPSTGQVKILDLLGERPENILPELLKSVRNYSLKSGTDLLSTNVAGHHYQAAFRKNLFFNTGRARCYLYLLASEAIDPASNSSGSFWFQMPIDRDNFSY